MASPSPHAVRHRLAIGAVVLAAGKSSRFGSENKLLADIAGQPLIRHVVDKLLSVNLEDVVVVTALDSAVSSALHDCGGVRIVPNPRAAEGMGTSIACGVSALGATLHGIMIVPGDMPALSADVLSRLGACFDAHDGTRIVYPRTAAGEQRNPVIWPVTFRPQLEALHGEVGGKALLQDLAALTASIIAADTALSDIDTPGELHRYLQGRGAADEI